MKLLFHAFLVLQTAREVSGLRQGFALTRVYCRPDYHCQLDIMKVTLYASLNRRQILVLETKLRLSWHSLILLDIKVNSDTETIEMGLEWRK